jgi:GMP synthase (glutamine-hydrolysing)
MQKLRVAILQHSDQTPPGTCLDWLESQGHLAHVHHLHRGEDLPDLVKTDFIIILGGPMNVDDETIHPWLRAEKEILKSAIAKGLPCLGLCLGGQLLAQALGGSVSPNKHWEIGWKTIEFSNQKPPLQVFQFHQDQFSLPPGAERLATNEITLNQAFSFSDHVIGTQFHPESTAEWVRYCATDKVRPASGPYVDSTEAMISGLTHLPAMTAWFFELLTRLEDRAYKNLRKSLS